MFKKLKASAITDKNRMQTFFKEIFLCFIDPFEYVLSHIKASFIHLFMTLNYHKDIY